MRIKTVIEIGKTFGRLTVLENIGKNKEMLALLGEKPKEVVLEKLEEVTITDTVIEAEPIK